MELIKINLVFNIKPEVKERPRFARIGKAIRTYTTSKTRNFENTIYVLAKAQLNGSKPLTGRLLVHAYFEIKKPRTSKLQIPHQDLDNFLKATLDALNGIAFEDDRQIASIYAHKRFAAENRIILNIEQF